MLITFLYLCCCDHPQKMKITEWYELLFFCKLWLEFALRRVLFGNVVDNSICLRDHIQTFFALKNYSICNLKSVIALLLTCHKMVPSSRERPYCGWRESRVKFPILTGLISPTIKVSRASSTSRVLLRTHSTLYRDLSNTVILTNSFNDLLSSISLINDCFVECIPCCTHRRPF